MPKKRRVSKPHVPLVLQAVDGDQKLRVRLCSSEDSAEQCPITLTSMDAEDSEDPSPVKADHPALRCLEIAPCSHRFNARALVRHFVFNKLNCPLCRTGCARPLDLRRAPFKKEAWARDALRAVAERAHRDRQQQVAEDWASLTNHFDAYHVEVDMMGATSVETLSTRMAVVDAGRCIHRCTGVALEALHRNMLRLQARELSFRVYGCRDGEAFSSLVMAVCRLNTGDLLQNSDVQIIHENGLVEQHLTLTTTTTWHLTLQVLIDREHMRWEFREIILFKQA